MRQERTVQASIFDLFAGHEIGRELKAMSQWLDEHRALVEPGGGAICAGRASRRPGGEGLPAESVLRCALLKQHRQLSYEELAFHLEDSASFRAFARLPLVVDAEEVGAAQDDQRDPRRDLGSDQSGAAGRAPARRRWSPAAMVRLDSTVTAALMHEPSDSSLLWDAVRVMVRLLQAGAMPWPADTSGSHGAITGARPRSGPTRSSSAAADRTGFSSTAS